MEAINFFALDFPKSDWPYVDEQVRLFYRLKAERAVRHCSAADCDRPTIALGLCTKHYQRLKRHGAATATRWEKPEKGEILQYLNTVVLPYDGEDCLTWPFARTKPNGPGVMVFRGRNTLVARVVCTLVRGEPPTSKHEAAHSCGKGHEACCNPHHLRWATRTENMHDKIAHGTVSRGEGHGRSKLTEQQAREILAMKGRLAPKAIASMYGLHPHYVSDILGGRKWAWLTPTSPAN